MDEIQFRWSRLFAHWFKPDSKLERWFNPRKSWRNKWMSKYAVVDFIMSTVLVFLTDFWHFLKFIFLNSFFLLILLLLDNSGYWYQYLLVMALMNIVWGLFFELFNGILGWLSDKYD